MTDDNFQNLIRRVRAGEEQAAQELVRDYEPYIRRAVRLQLNDRRVRRVCDSIDVCQAVLASFFTRAAKGRFDLETPGDLVKLLAAMARNKASKQVRGQRAEGRDVARLTAEPVQNLQVAHDDPSPSHQASVREIVDKAQCCTPTWPALKDWRVFEWKPKPSAVSSTPTSCKSTPWATTTATRTWPWNSYPAAAWTGT